MRHHIHKLSRATKDRLQFMLDDWTGNAIGAGLFCIGLTLYHALAG